MNRIGETTFRGDIEGLRALAIIAVVGYHAGLAGFEGGYVGVDIFFVLSGYLITWKLIGEIEKTGRVDYSRFFARRARRLLPALMLVIALVSMASVFVYAPFEHRAIAHQALSSSAYVSNIYFALVATDYMHAAHEILPLLHTWSLSVEEQFYLFWPFLVFYGLHRRNEEKPDTARLTILMLVVASISLAASILMTPVRQPYTFFLSPFRFWEFAAGALCLLWKIPIRREVSFGLGLTGLLGIATSVAAFDRSIPYPGVAALLPVVATAMVLKAGEMREASRTILSFGPLQYIGRVSYAWYLWHWPALIMAATLGLARDRVQTSAVAGVSFVLAVISYHLFENPIRRSRYLAGRPVRSLLMAAVFVLGGVALSLIWRSVAANWAGTLEQARFLEARLDRPSIEHFCPDRGSLIRACGDDRGGMMVVLFGDSYAEQWFPAVQAISSESEWSLYTAIEPGCPPVDAKLGGGYLANRPTRCNEWLDRVLVELEALDPGLTIVSAYDEYDVGAGEWYEGSIAVFAKLKKASGRTVFIEATPNPRFDVTRCLARAEWYPDLMPRDDCAVRFEEVRIGELATAQRRAASVAGGIELIDMGDAVGGLMSDEPCGAVYRDAGHLTTRASICLGDELGRRLGTNRLGNHSSDLDG